MIVTVMAIAAFALSVGLLILQRRRVRAARVALIASIAAEACRQEAEAAWQEQPSLQPMPARVLRERHVARRRRAAEAAAPARRREPPKAA
jgi:hypothetical protein